MTKLKSEYYAIIMLNRTVSNFCVARRFQLSGYQPVKIDPLENETPTSQCIQVLKEHVDNIHSSKRIIICAIESNYGHSGSHKCNQTMLNYICDNVCPFYLSVYSATPESLQDTQNWYNSRKNASECGYMPKLILVDFNLPDQVSNEKIIPNISKTESPIRRKTKVAVTKKDARCCDFVSNLFGTMYGFFVSSEPWRAEEDSAENVQYPESRRASLY